MKISPAAALADVEYATRARRLAESDSAAAVAAQVASIRIAMEAGASADDVARRAGMSRRRVYQLLTDDSA